jgi:hypothetical protein
MENRRRVILVASIYLCLFAFAPWPVSMASLGLLLFFWIIGLAMFASQGSLRAKLKWLVDRLAVGSFVVAFAFLLLIEDFLRRSS